MLGGWIRSAIVGMLVLFLMLQWCPPVAIIAIRSCNKSQDSRRPSDVENKGIGRRKHSATRGSDLAPGADLKILVEGGCYHVATRTPGTRRIQEDIQLRRVAYFAYA
jgi:hypothetical protein